MVLTPVSLASIWGIHISVERFALKIHDLTALSATGMSRTGSKLWFSLALTAVFAILGRAVRGVTTTGALAGALACFALLQAAGPGGFAALLTVFVLTWASTRVGYARKQSLGTAEARTGRGAFQVLANLGVAAACALAYAAVRPDGRLLVALGASLAEAAADTVSSEIGQAVGGVPYLVTTWRKTAPGTDGAISLVGTTAGTAAALVVGLTSAATGVIPWRSFLVCSIVGTAGMLFDSLLGATLERKRILGNNAVNFFSTALAAVAAFLTA